MAFHLDSRAFRPSEIIPTEYTGEGVNVSPPLHWEDVPEGTKELALICEDPDAPGTEPFVHWIAYKIPPEVGSLPRALPRRSEIKSPLHLHQGENSYGKIGYGGPYPPKGRGRHHYHFKLYALDTELPVKTALDKDQLVEIMQGHVLDVSELVGIYERQ